VTIRTRVDGALEQLHFTEGQDVKKGDLLAVIDPRPFQAALDQAIGKSEQDRAALENARAILNRTAQLEPSGYATQQMLDTQKSNVQQLEATVAQDEAAVSNAKTQLSYTQITAPISGRTGIRLVDVGNIIHATDTTGIVVITQLQPIDVIATFADRDLPAVRSAVRAGKVPAVARSRDGTQQLDAGTLELFDNQIDPNSATIRLKATFPNKEEALWPGQFVLLQVRTRVARDAVVVPSGAVQRGADGFFVYVVGKDDRAELRTVKTGPIADERAIIETGLKAGERVVVTGQYRVAPGVLLKTTQEAGPVAASEQKG
jgi:multidrug efflux system membrane fusion protein